MTARAWPLDAASGSPQYTGRYLRQTTVAPFLLGATAGRPLGARSGVRPGTSPTTVTATSTLWTVNPLAGVIDVESANEAGPYAFSFDQAITGSVTAASSSYARIDLISVQINDNAEDGSSLESVAIVYTAGTAPAPAIPAAPVRSFAIAQINVPISGGGSPSVTWVAPYLTAAGGVIPVRNATERNAAAAALGASAALPVRTWRADGTDLRQQEVTIDGSTFRYVPQTAGLQTWGVSLSTGSVGAGSVVGTYMILGNVCFWNLDISIGSGFGVGSGSYVWGLPVAPAPGNVLGQGYYYNGAFQTFLCQYAGSSTVQMRAGNGTLNTWGSSYAPFSAGNVASFSGSYLIA